MIKKQAWRRVHDEFGYTWIKADTTGRCKKLTGGPYLKPGEEKIFFEVNVPAILKKNRTKWIDARDFKFCDPITEEIYECNCANTTNMEE